MKTAHTNNIAKRQSEQAKQRANVMFRDRPRKATTKEERRGEECPQLDGSNFLPPLAVERILPVTKSWLGKLIFPARDITWLRTTPAVSAVRNRLMKRAEITVIHASRFRAMGVQLTTFGMLASVCSFREKAENTRAAKRRKYLL
jgi:hypothetical protein